MDGVVDISEERIDSAHECIALPCTPATKSGRSVHRCICNRLPCSVNITFDSSSGAGVAICQDDGCGRGKRAAKYMRNFWLGSNAGLNVPSCATGPWISGIIRDATSARVLSTPGIDTTAGQAEWVVRWRIARPLSSRWAIVGDWPRADILVTQDNEGVLSQWMIDRR
eukprot:scaffold35684_cov59-Attheya_sp.AAC.2